MARLDIYRQQKLEPKRMDYAINKLQELGFDVIRFGDTRIEFEYKGCTIKFYPYSGWASGKSINDGIGIHNLLKQLKDGHKHIYINS